MNNISNNECFYVIIVFLLTQMESDEYRQAKADSRTHRVPRRNNRLTRTEMSPAAEASSEEENTTPRRQRPRRTPRSKNNTPRDVGPVPLPSSKLPEKSGVHGGPLRQSGESMSRTLVGSPSGCNVSRKSLREISRKKMDELRASVVCIKIDMYTLLSI